MNAPSETVGSRFVDLWQAWNSIVPKKLVRQNPLAVFAILEMCDGRGGRFQMEIRSELGLGESHLSKLLEKLVQVRWIAVTSKDSPGGKHRIRITRKGREVLSELRGRIVQAPPVPARRGRWRGVRPAKGQLSFDLSSQRRRRAAK
jgi:DNA-binding PadR family transcriptional regulator